LEDCNVLIASAASIMAHIALNDAARAILREVKNLIANEPEIKEEKLGMGRVYGGVVLTKIDELKSELEIEGYKVCVISFNQQNHPITVLDRSVQHLSRASCWKLLPTQMDTRYYMYMAGSCWLDMYTLV
jgi:hypothetical protein